MSPAPIVSTTTAVAAGTWASSPAAVSTVRPSPPRVSTTAAGPLRTPSTSSRAAASASAPSGEPRGVLVGHFSSRTSGSQDANRLAVGARVGDQRRAGCWGRARSARRGRIPGAAPLRTPIAPGSSTMPSWCRATATVAIVRQRAWVGEQAGPRCPRRRTCTAAEPSASSPSTPSVVGSSPRCSSVVSTPDSCSRSTIASPKTSVLTRDRNADRRAEPSGRDRDVERAAAQPRHQRRQWDPGAAGNQVDQRLPAYDDHRPVMFRPTPSLVTPSSSSSRSPVNASASDTGDRWRELPGLDALDDQAGHLGDQLGVDAAEDPGRRHPPRGTRGCGRAAARAAGTGRPRGPAAFAATSAHEPVGGPPSSSPTPSK